MCPKLQPVLRVLGEKDIFMTSLINLYLNKHKGVLRISAFVDVLTFLVDNATFSSHCHVLVPDSISLCGFFYKWRIRES